MGKIAEWKKKAIIKYREQKAQAAADKAYQKEIEEKEYGKLRRKQLASTAKANARRRVEGGGGFLGSLQGVGESLSTGILDPTPKRSKKRRREDYGIFGPGVI